MSEIELKGEKVVAVASAAVPAGAAPTGAQAPGRSDQGSFGRALAAAREARGLSQADVATQLRLHMRQVQAIEAEDLAALPEGPFVRGYVRNFARLVDLPAEPLLSLLNARLTPTDPLRSQTVAGAVSPIQRTAREPHTARIVIAVVVLVLAVLAVLGWWSMRASESVPAAPVPVAEAPPSPVAAPPLPQAELSAEPAAEPVAAQATAESPAAASPAGAAVAAPELRLQFRERSWVEIRQADGSVLVSQTHESGTTRTVQGTPPYTLVIGNASKVDLEFRGQAIDLLPYVSRGDIARLRLE